MKNTNPRFSLLIAALMIPISAGVHAATISTVAWGADPSSNGQVDWSGGNSNYTHAINIGGPTPDLTFVAADGYGLTGGETMTFYTQTTNTFSGPGGTGTLNARNFRTYSAASSGDLTIDNAGGTLALTEGFRWEGPSGSTIATLTLTGLATNQAYELVLYQTTTAFAGNPSTLDFVNSGTGSSGNASQGGINRGGNKVTIAYTTGNNTSVSLTTTPESAGTWHWYAFSNEIIPEPSTTSLLGLGMLMLIGRRRR